MQPSPETVLTATKSPRRNAVGRNRVTMDKRESKEPVDLTMLLKHLKGIELKVDDLRKHLPCLDIDTEPDCRWASERAGAITESELLDAGNTEPHSALTEPVSFHARRISYRGPAWVAAAAMIGVLASLIAALISGHVSIH